MPKTIVIADTSCLILLEKLQMLDVLPQLFGEITITRIVANEFGKDIPKWINIVDPKVNTGVLILESSLDPGEASSIALALEYPESLLIIDDLKGRRMASRLGIHITGIFGIFIVAKNEGVIPMIKPVLEKIRKTNFRFSKKIEIEILRQSNEL